MDFDKPKVYGDTSITDGLVFELGRTLINDVEIYSERDYKSHTFEQE